MFDRKTFFDCVRKKPFGGSLSQQQVDGMDYKLQVWEKHFIAKYPDLRWLAYALATSKHETASTMWPIEEYGKGGNAAYAKPDPTTGKCYWGRGDVMLTWADNYKKATKELVLTGDNDLYWHPEQALDPAISAAVLYTGMIEGWFRTKDGKPETLERHFSETVDDAYGARNIINGDTKTVPSWSGGVSIGNIVAGYHRDFLNALDASWVEEAPEVPEPQPQPEPDADLVSIAINTTGNAKVTIVLNGVIVETAS